MAYFITSENGVRVVIYSVSQTAKDLGNMSGFLCLHFISMTVHCYREDKSTGIRGCGWRDAGKDQDNPHRKPTHWDPSTGTED